MAATIFSINETPLASSDCEPGSSDIPSSSIPSRDRGGIGALARAELRAGTRTTGPIGRPAGRRPALARGATPNRAKGLPAMKSSRNVLFVDQRPVGSCEPPAPWLGGKRNLAKRICAILAHTPHVAYVEPFIGMGGVFLRRSVRPAVEVINDLNGDVVTLFRVLQRFPEALLRELQWRPAIRSEFDRLKETRDCDLLDIERAARFIYLQTLAFGGKVASQHFGVSPGSPHNFDLARVEPRLRRLHSRMAGVVIENLDWLDLISRYDRDGTLFYLDPPYWGGESDYGSGMFVRGDFQRMADKLQAIEGRFILSINDRPEIREIFSWADIEAVQTTYSVAGGEHAAPAAELIIAKGVDLAAASRQPSLF